MEINTAAQIYRSGLDINGQVTLTRHCPWTTFAVTNNEGGNASMCLNNVDTYNNSQKWHFSNNLHRKAHLIIIQLLSWWMSLRNTVLSCIMMPIKHQILSQAIQYLLRSNSFCLCATVCGTDTSHGVHGANINWLGIRSRYALNKANEFVPSDS